MQGNRSHFDVIVVGSGFGGSMAAWPLVEAGLEVLMLERGPWVTRGEHNWGPEGTLTATPYFAEDILHRSPEGVRREGTCACVGGPSVFYGGVSTRFREHDFRPASEIVGDSGARWPLAYPDLRPHYDRAERILGVAGDGAGDPFGPERKNGYPRPLNGLTGTARMIHEAAESLGLRPYRLPLAIHYGGESTDPGREACIACGTCDTFACAIRAKNDLSVQVIPRLQARGLRVRPETAVAGFLHRGDRVTGVECRDVASGRNLTFTADAFVLAAGALASPTLLLASGLAERNPAAEAVGAYLTRHCSSIVFGCYRKLPCQGETFHKQIGINDFYFGDPGNGGPPGKLGNIQQVQTPTVGMVGTRLSRLATWLVSPIVRRATGLLVLAEDQPRRENRVEPDPTLRDRFGAPAPLVRHRYSDRDLAARTALERRAREIHGRAGALFTYIHRIDTFSHALGTLRMGDDPRRAPLDPEGRFRGLANLRVADGSTFPTSAGVNPSLTIAANALRIGEAMLEDRVGQASFLAGRGEDRGA